MNTREHKMKLISNEFAKWQIQIENLNSLSLYDANIFSEYTLCELLNIIFRLNMNNANIISTNFPSVDLVDDENKVAVQVTSTKTKAKIQNTIDKFNEKKLYVQYERLYIIILGARQEQYNGLEVPPEFMFDPSEQILDFKSLLKLIVQLPLKDLEKVHDVVTREGINYQQNKRTSTNASLVKRKLLLKRKLQKDFLVEVDKSSWECVRYEPYRKFLYHNAIIRSVDDRSWPDLDDDNETKMSSWFKGEFWNFYENGLELITQGGEVIFDKNGNWDILDWKGDKRKESNQYSKEDFFMFLRIPYEFIVDYDMEPDEYNGIPTIYVEYKKDNMPYEEILYGRPGHFDKVNRTNSYFTSYFDKSKRRKLE